MISLAAISPHPARLPRSLSPIALPAFQIVATKPVTIGILGFDGVRSLDLTGPLETFAAAHVDGPDGKLQRCYEVVVIGVTGKTFVSDAGIIFKAQRTLATAPALDTIIVPGGLGIRTSRISAMIANSLTPPDRFRRIVGVSSGIYAIATSGLLDGRHVTTHWRFAPVLGRQFPHLRINSAISFCKDGSFHSCGGGTAAMEMTLSLIKEDYGTTVALAVARELVMDLRPPGNEQDDIQMYNYDLDSTERLADLPAWIAAHLHRNLSTESLAKRASLCPRHFSRLFKKLHNTTPADFVEQMRLAEARRRLLSSRNCVAVVAASVGFKSVDTFCRAFQRRFEITPRDFRTRRDFSSKSDFGRAVSQGWPQYLKRKISARASAK